MNVNQKSSSDSLALLGYDAKDSLSLQADAKKADTRLKPAVTMIRYYGPLTVFCHESQSFKLST